MEISLNGSKIENNKNRKITKTEKIREIKTC
jgi:hypothetical protein